MEHLSLQVHDYVSLNIKRRSPAKFTLKGANSIMVVKYKLRSS